MTLSYVGNSKKPEDSQLPASPVVCRDMQNGFHSRDWSVTGHVSKREQNAVNCLEPFFCLAMGEHCIMKNHSGYNEIFLKTWAVITPDPFFMSQTGLNSLAKIAFYNIVMARFHFFGL